MNTAWKSLSLVVVLAAVWSVACSGGKPGAQEPEAAVGATYENVIWESASQIEELCEKHIAAAVVLRDQLASGPKLGGLETLQLLNHLEVELEQAYYPSELYANVHPDEDVRAAAEKCKQRAAAFFTELQLNRELYDVLAAVEVSDPLAQRYLKHWLRDYRRSGVDKEPEVRERLGAIQDELVVAGQGFHKAIRDDRRTIEVTREQLAGMPEDFIAARRQEGTEIITLSTDYTDYFPVMQYAENEDVRRGLYLEFTNRAYPANEEVLNKIFSLRQEYATTLGYANWADYNAEDKMIGSGDAAAKFIDRVAQIARERADAEKVELSARKQKDLAEGQSAVIQYWDRFYYVGKIREERYGVDSQLVRQYFPYQQVLDGAMKVYEEMFGVTFQPVPDAPVWHESVRAFDLIDGGEALGRFFLDMHPREGKYKHAAMFPLHGGVSGMQKPVASLVCNFPAPTADSPALMEHLDVTVLFHEFGHLVHHMLASRVDWHRFSGVATEWDFVEAPSQILEEWAWDAEILQRFGHHYETGEPIPAELVEKMRAAKEFGKGVYVMRQLFFAALSHRYHSMDATGMDINEVFQTTEKAYSPYPVVEDNHFYASFGHLDGYSSMYYTYMWSLMIAKDLFSRFEEKGMNNPDVAGEYRQKVIEPGGSKDAADLVSDFLGREIAFDAFQKWLES